MAKEKNGRLRQTIYIVSGLVALLVTVVGAVSGYKDWTAKTAANKETIAEHKEGVTKGFEYMVKHQDKEMAALKSEGCGPARKATMDNAVFKNRLDTFEKNQDDFKVEQQDFRKETREGFEKILERLP